MLALVISIIALYIQNLTEVIEKPEKNWSRALQIGQTSTNNYPTIRKTKNNTIELLELTNDSLQKKIYNNTMTLKSTDTYKKIPVNKWTKFYADAEQLLYFDDHTIIDGTTNEPITAADNFFPLPSAIFYTKDQQLVHLDPKTKTQTVVPSFDETYDDIVITKTQHGYGFLSYKQQGSQIKLNIDHKGNGITNQVVQDTVEIPLHQTIEETTLAMDGEKIAFVLKTKTKGTGGKAPVNTIYLYESVNDSLQKLSFDDPKSEGTLSDVSDISLTFHEGQLRLLFYARGATQTKFREEVGYNIYEATRGSHDFFDVYRRSNTPFVSVKPQRLSPNMITWVDIKNETNPIYLASDQQEIIEKTDSVNQDDLIRGLGKTIGMLSVSFIAIILAFHWLIGPVLFLAISFFTSRKLLDNDTTWLYYGGLVSYFFSFFIFNNRFFIDHIYQTAPNYLTFTGSQYVYGLLFAIIAFVSTHLGSRIKEWSSLIKLFYFITVHVLLLTIVFGPYIF